MKAQPAATVEEAEAALKNALAALKIQEAMRDRLLDLAREQTRRPFVVLIDQGPTAPQEKVNYRSLASEGIGTILEISVLTLGLSGPWSIDPSLSLTMTVRTRLIRSDDGRELHSHTLDYRSETREFSGWTAANAYLFRSELDTAYQALSEKIVEEVFLVYSFPGR